MPQGRSMAKLLTLMPRSLQAPVAVRFHWSKSQHLVWLWMWSNRQCSGTKRASLWKGPAVVPNLSRASRYFWEKREKRRTNTISYEFNFCQFNVFLTKVVVSTILFSSHFCRFCTDKRITKGFSFLSLTSQLFKKVPVEIESSFSMGGAIILITLFGQNYILEQQQWRHKESFI